MKQSENDDNFSVKYDLNDVTSVGLALFDISNWYEWLLRLVEASELLFDQFWNKWDIFLHAIRVCIGNEESTCCPRCREIVAINRQELEGFSQDSFLNVANQINNIPGDSVFVANRIGTKGEDRGTRISRKDESMKSSFTFSLPVSSTKNAVRSNPYSVLTSTKAKTVEKTCSQTSSVSYIHLTAKKSKTLERACSYNSSSAASSKKNPGGFKSVLSGTKLNSQEKTCLHANSSLPSTSKSPSRSESVLTSTKPKIDERVCVHASTSTGTSTNDSILSDVKPDTDVIAKKPKTIRKTKAQDSLETSRPTEATNKISVPLVSKRPKRKPKGK